LAAALRAEVPMPTPPVPAAPTYVETAWSAKVDAGSRLVAENGRVFLLSRAAGLEVIRGDDGTVVLKHDLQVPVGEALVPVNLTVSGKDALIWMVEESMAYHAGAPLTLVVCNLADGAVRWTRPLGERPVTLAERAGRLHILFLDSSSVVLSTEDGEEIRREPAGSVPPINHGLALDGSGGEALAVQLRVAVRDASGQVRWERTLPVEDDFAAPVYGALAWIDPLLVASRSDGVLVAYRVDDGTEVWQVEGRCGIASLTPLGAGRGLLVQDFEGVVRSMTTGDAKEQWSFAPPRVRENARPRPPICREGLVALPSPGDGITFFLDAETGEVLHALRTSPAAQLAIDAGMIYVLDHDRLWALRRPVADRSTPDTPGRLEQRAPSE